MARKETTDRLTCKACGGVIDWRKRSDVVWLSIGPMHGECQKKHREKIDGIIAQAIAEGRHSDIEDWTTVCDGCGRWVCAIHYVTEAGKRLCHGCTPITDRADYRRPPLIMQPDIPLDI